jgi:hypothetical protein
VRTARASPSERWLRLPGLFNCPGSRLVWLSRKTIRSLSLIVTRVILPKRNFKDVQADLPESTTKQMNFAYVGTIEEALEEVWGRDVWAVKSGARVEARL